MAASGLRCTGYVVGRIARSCELRERAPEEGSGWQAGGMGLHERGAGPGDRVSLPYLTVDDLAAKLEQVRTLGGEIIHPGDRWAICRDSEGSPFALAARRDEA